MFWPGLHSRLPSLGVAAYRDQRASFHWQIADVYNNLKNLIELKFELKLDRKLTF